jgi:lipopolysaccharide transport system permease protein
MVPARGRPSASPLAMPRALVQHRELIRQLVRQELVGRYRGSLLGIAWSFATPVLMLLIYTFVFSIVFQARWGEALGGGRATFAVVLFAGMTVFNLFSEVVVRAPTLVIANASYVKRVVFPLEVLPVVSMGAALFHFLVALFAWGIAALAVLHRIPWTAVLLPLVIVPLMLGTLGVAWVLASLGVFLRDLAQSIGLFVTALLFLTPIFYPVAAIPDEYQWVVTLNPLAVIVDQARQVLIFGTVPSVLSFVGSWTVALLIAAGGFAWFQKTRSGFADVL